MVHIDFKNSFGDVTQGAWQDAAKKLPDFLRLVQTRGQGFYSELDNDALIKKISNFARANRGRYTSIVVLGIGGSALGTIFLAQSLRHLYHNELKKNLLPRLYVLDNIDPILLRETEEAIDIKKTLFIVITKSGGTPETLSQFFYFRKKVPTKQFIFITDAENGFLRSIARNENYTTFAIPPNIGGRFSVLTAVGLLPAALLGIHIGKLIRGARAMRDAFLSANFSQNLPFQLAAMQYLQYQQNKHINVLMPYSQKLIRLADWYRQLLAESIGKAKNRAGELVHVGITPVNALGVTDQHSQLQLYSEGPLDKYFIFVRVLSAGKKLAIPAAYPGEASLHFLKNKSFNDLLDVEYQGTAEALTKNNRPNATLTISAVTEEEIGSLILLLEGATAFLGEWFGVDAFDQPGVELSKKITKEILLRKK